MVSNVKVIKCSPRIQHLWQTFCSLIWRTKLGTLPDNLALGHLGSAVYSKRLCNDTIKKLSFINNTYAADQRLRHVQVYSGSSAAQRKFWPDALPNVRDNSHSSESNPGLPQSPITKPQMLLKRNNNSLIKYKVRANSTSRIQWSPLCHRCSIYTLL